jgi:peptide deformylase
LAEMPILRLPNPILRHVALPFDRIDDAARRLARDMLETMYAAGGVGLAAPQVGILRRMIVIDLSKKDEEKKPLVLINPEITAVSGERSTFREGCLSIPRFLVEVERPASVSVHYLDPDGHSQDIHADGILATVLQHEIDHLNGKLFIDYISDEKRDIIVAAYSRDDAPVPDEIITL